MSLTVVILAAGKSTRFKSRVPKVLHPLAGKQMLAYTLELANRFASTPPVMVVGPETEAEIRAWAGDRAQLVLQRERLGTGHAVLQTRPLLEGRAERVLVLYGDMPLLREETLRDLVALYDEEEATIALLTVERENPRGFGRIVRDDDGRVVAIVEEAEATPEIAAIRELNTGIGLFDAAFLWEHLTRLQPSPQKGEYYLTDLTGMAAEEGRRVAGLPLEDPSEGLGINTRADLAVAVSALRARINRHWMLEGVTLVDPQSTYIDADVVIGRDSVIHPNSHLRGQTAVGEESEIGPNSILEDATVGNRCRVVASVLTQAVMEDESDIGPFSHLRKSARVCRGAHVGNFGEIKKSTLGPGSKMGHFSYLGDAEVGAGVNIGAGTITCNYDGERKHLTRIEDGVFIGSDTMLVAPLHIGEGARTGAGSVVTRDLRPGALAYGVPAREVRKAEDEPPEES